MTHKHNRQHVTSEATFPKIENSNAELTQLHEVKSNVAATAAPPASRPSLDMEKQHDDAAGGPLTNTVSVDAYGNTYPEGGLRAWLVVYGAFSAMTASFGLMNSIGTFQAYLSTHQLANVDPSTLGWVFSIYTFLAFFCGIQIGPFFDAKGPRALVVAGTVCMVGGTFGIAESTSKYSVALDSG